MDSHAINVMQAVWQYRVGQKVEKYDQEGTAKLEKARDAKSKQTIIWTDQKTGITHNVSLVKWEDCLSTGTTASVSRYVPGKLRQPSTRAKDTIFLHKLPVWLALLYRPDAPSVTAKLHIPQNYAEF
jgi:hypothetical protein